MARTWPAQPRLGLRLGLGPTVGGGVLATGLAVVASTKSWLEVGDSGALAPAAVLSGLSEAPPLASSLSLVLLASWGALLVTRGQIRRVVAALATLAAVVLVVVTVAFGANAAADAKETLAALGVDKAEASLGFWFWIALLAALASAGLAFVAVLTSPNWPEMSRRYDAPGSERGDPEGTDLTSTIDVWKAMDQGKDPTA